MRLSTSWESASWLSGDDEPSVGGAGLAVAPGAGRSWSPSASVVAPAAGPGEWEAPVEQDVEQRLVLEVLDQRGLQGAAQHAPVGQVEVAESLGGVEHLDHGHVDVGGPQLAQEAEQHGQHRRAGVVDVVLVGRGPHGLRCYARCADRTFVRSANNDREGCRVAPAVTPPPGRLVRLGVVVGDELAEALPPRSAVRPGRDRRGLGARPGDGGRRRGRGAPGGRGGAARERRTLGPHRARVHRADLGRGCRASRPRSHLRGLRPAGRGRAVRSPGGVSGPGRRPGPPGRDRPPVRAARRSGRARRRGAADGRGDRLARHPPPRRPALARPARARRGPHPAEARRPVSAWRGGR